MSVRLRRFDELSRGDAYGIWRMRQDVFVVEQGCPYPDLDGRDTEPGTIHALLYDDEALAGTLRVLDDEIVWRIGRVLLARSARGRKLADDLLDAVLPELVDRPIVMAAQAPLAPWYATFGFQPYGPEFIEDGIPHLPLRHP